MILITGAAGFIGSAVACTLNLQGRKDLILCDRFGKSEKWKNRSLCKRTGFARRARGGSGEDVGRDRHHCQDQGACPGNDQEFPGKGINAEND